MKCELGKEINSNKGTKIKCKVCIKHEQNIIWMKTFTKSWINTTTSVKKDSLEKHVKGDPHLHAVDLEKKKKQTNLGQILTIKRWFLLGQ